jgi:hypothetical protein
MRRLDLDLAEAVLPDGGEGSDTVLTEVNQDVPKERRVSIKRNIECHQGFQRCYSHGITVHGGAHEDIVVVVVGNDLLHGDGGVLLELVDALGAGASLLELLEDLLEVT